MRSKKSSVLKSLMLFQMEDCNISYSQYPEGHIMSSIIYDTIKVNAKTILSNHKGIKVGDIIEFNFKPEPYLTDEKCKPEAFGHFMAVNKKLVCYIYVSTVFPQRLDFILNRGIKPYFDLGCEREKYEKPIVKTFSMESGINLEDYINI